MQRPQRTWPERACSCVGVTRKSVRQRGQRVTRLMGAISATRSYSACCECASAANAREEHPSRFILRSLEIVPRAVREPHVVRLLREYARERERSAGKRELRDQRREHDERFRE